MTYQQCKRCRRIQRIYAKELCMCCYMVTNKQNREMKNNNVQKMEKTTIVELQRKV